MEQALPAVRVRLPCNDAREFEARLAGHIATKGLRIPSERRRPIGSRLRVALELKNGETLCGEAVVEAHVQLDGRAGVSVRFLRPPAAEEPTPVGADDLVIEEGAPEPAEPPAPAPEVDPLGASAEILASANRQVTLLVRGVVALSVLAFLLAGAGYAVGLGLARRSPAALAAARVAAADRLLADGRILGRDGALEQLLAARELRPGDPGVAERLSRLAALLESLGAKAIDRGDLAVAAVHLAAAELAEPTRESVRAKRAWLAAKERADEAPPRPAARTRKRR